ncbi:MAG: hypothetical protein Q8W48_09125, partial [Candidatus Palauibacterales bacterium]|nr:hypothetical protein [Candidatus Palauibacterales bacterium]
MRPVLDLPPPQPADAGAIDGLAGLELPEPIATILVNRGFTAESAKAFLRPRLADLHDPWTMAGME